MGLIQLQAKLAFFLVIFILCQCGYSEANVKRKLSLAINPDCNISLCNNLEFNKENYNLIYVRADGPNDTLHHLWSNIGSFTVLTVLTALHVNVTIDWAKFLSSNNSGSINFTELPIHSYATSFTKLWDFIDKNDTANFDAVSAENKTPHPFKEFKWNNLTIQKNTEEEVSVDFSLSENCPLTNGFNRTFIKLSAFGNEGRPDNPPRLLYNSNVTQVEVLLERLKTNASKSRFALEMVLLTSDISQGNFTDIPIKTLDDEYTPGIFSVVEIVNERKSENERGGYLQWKPICYTSSDRIVENSTDVKLNLPHQQMNNSNCSKELNGSLAGAFFECDNINSVLVQFATVSFGAKEDKFYQHFNYSTWTLNIGYGALPKDEISTTVILVIVIGLGIPVLLIIGGGIYIGVKRCKAKKDDLLLEQ